MKKLWNDVNLAQMKPLVCHYIRDGCPSNLLKVSLEKFGLLVCIQKECHGGNNLIHVSVSMDIGTVEPVMAILGCCNLKMYMEEVIQACFGYDFLLIEDRFEVSFPDGDISPKPASKISSNPEDYVYHWFYKL